MVIVGGFFDLQMSMSNGQMHLHVSSLAVLKFVGAGFRVLNSTKFSEPS